MDCLDDMTIQHYFDLKAECEQLKKYSEFLHQSFYLQNMATHVEYGDLGLFSRGFRQETELERLEDCLELIKDRIRRNSFRYKHFMSYLDQLSKADQEALKQRYMLKYGTSITGRLARETIAEIAEIETALCFREGLEVPIERVELSNDLMANIDYLAGVEL